MVNALGMYRCEYTITNKNFGTEENPFFRNGWCHFKAEKSINELELNIIAVREAALHEHIKEKYIDLKSVEECSTLKGLKEVIEKVKVDGTINCNIELNDEDIKLINVLVSSPYRYMFNKIGRRYSKNGNREPEKSEDKLIFIDDLSVGQLEDLLPKIDVYVKEEYEQRVKLGSYDEVWMIAYWSLKDKILSKLSTNQ